MTGRASTEPSPEREEAVPSHSGTASLTLSDLEALEHGRITRAEIAARCGVSRQAIAKWCKKIRNRGVSGHGKPKSVGRRTTTEAKPIEFSGDDAQKLAISAAFGAIIAVEEALRATTLGPSSIKASVAALTDAVTVLERFRVLDQPEVREHIPALVIRRMAVEDEASIRMTNNDET